MIVRESPDSGRVTPGFRQCLFVYVFREFPASLQSILRYTLAYYGILWLLLSSRGSAHGAVVYGAHRVTVSMYRKRRNEYHACVHLGTYRCARNRGRFDGDGDEP